MTPDHIDTVRLLLAITPTVFASGRFAMKGGTALNLFVQDMPRRSIDIDVVYVDHRPDREGALKTISSELAAMKAALKAKGYRATLPTNPQGDEVKLVVGNDARRSQPGRASGCPSATDRRSSATADRAATLLPVVAGSGRTRLDAVALPASTGVACAEMEAAQPGEAEEEQRHKVPSPGRRAGPPHGQCQRLTLNMPEGVAEDSRRRTTAYFQVDRRASPSVPAFAGLRAHLRRT